MKFTRSFLLSAIALAASAVCAPAQDNNPNPDQPRRGGPGGNPEEFRQRMADRLKTMLKVNNDEWAVLQPLMENVQTKQREAMMGGGFGGRGGPGGGWGGGRGGDRQGRGAGAAGAPEGAGAQGGGGERQGGGRGGRGGSPEAQALRTALENDATSPEELKSKLAALREQRRKAAAELVQAREDLRKVVTVRQEATLVSMGLLE